VGPEMTLPFLLSTFQSGIVNLQIHSEPKVSSVTFFSPHGIFRSPCYLNRASNLILWKEEQPWKKRGQPSPLSLLSTVQLQELWRDQNISKTFF
jgi:hypothetical protein